MGCACSSKTITCIQIEENPKKSSLNEKICSFTFENDSFEQVIILGVWSSSTSLLESFFPAKLFPQIYTPSCSITFNLIPLLDDPEQVLDGLLFISDKSTDKEEILKKSEKHSKVSMKFLINPNFSLNFNSNLIKTLRNKDSFIVELANQVIELENYLKEIFRKIDRDLDGVIGRNDVELVNFNVKFQDFCSDLIKFFDGMKEEEKKMDFNTFCVWCKRGRLGAKPFVDVTSTWAAYFERILPEFKRDMENLITETSLEKVVMVNDQAPENGPKAGIEIFVGNSAKREFILREVTGLLGLGIYELWLVAKIEYKSELQAKYSLCTIDSMIESLRHTLLSYIWPDSDIGNFILTKVKQINTQIYISLAFDINHDSIEEALAFVQHLDSILRSPKDDYIQCKVSCQSPLQDFSLFTHFKQHFDSTSVLIQSSIWKKFSSFLKAKSKIDSIIKLFLDFSGEIKLGLEDLEGVPSLSWFLDVLVTPLKKLLGFSFQLQDFIKSFGNDLQPSLTVYVRMGNYGGLVSLQDENLEKLFC